MPEFKYILFFAVLIVGVPAGFLISKYSRLVEKSIFFLMIFFTCRLSETINFVSHEHYRGTSRGFEITLVDLASIIIFLLVISRRNQYKLKLLPPGSLLYFFYFLFSCISLVNSGNTTYSMFEVWKMIRMYFFFWTIFNYLREPNQIKELVNFISYIIIYSFMIVIYQKYLLGLYQTNGPFPHQNSLVMYMIVFNSIMFSQLLNCKESLMKNIYTFSVFGAGCLCIIFTLSRAGLACFAIAVIIVWAISLLINMETKKIAVTVVLIVAGSLIAIKSLDSIIRRFETAPESSKNSRIELAHAAINMANDKVSGIGLNNFGLKVNPPYPYADHIARPTPDFKEGLVETTYLMIAAETGWHNLVVFLFWIGIMYIRNLRNLFRSRDNELRFLIIAVTGGLAGIYLESTLEWVLKQTNNFYQLMIIFALIGVISRMLDSGIGQEDKNELPE